MKIGILTSGGDCPGLNAVIRGVVLKGTTTYDLEFVGIRDGWRGVVDGDFFPLTRHEVKGLSKVGGTILGTSRTNPYEGPRGGAENIAKTLYGHRIDGIIAIGGEGTLAAADRLVERRHQRHRRAQDDRQRPARDRLLVRLRHGREHRHRRHGPPAHDRRLAPALHGRRGHGPPRRLDRPARRHRRRRPRDPASPRCRCRSTRSCALVTQGARPRPRAAGRGLGGLHAHGMDEAFSDKGLDAFNRPRLGGISEVLAPEIERITGIETRATVLGHIQRGGSPSGFDRVLATRLGLHAADAVVDGAWGQMVALQRHRHRARALRRGAGRAQHRAAVPLRRGRRALRLTRRALGPRHPLGSLLFVETGDSGQGRGCRPLPRRDALCRSTLATRPQGGAVSDSPQSAGSTRGGRGRERCSVRR